MKSLSSTTNGFSLIEVVIAIGVVAYVIFGVFGLLPVGMKTFRNANQQSASANVMNSLAESIRSAVTTNGSDYVWTFNGQSFTYTVGGGTATNTWNFLTMQGLTASNSLDGQLRVVALVTPPSTPYGEGNAVLSVVWPAAANPVWNPSTLKWSRSEGSGTIGIRFLPRPRQP